MEANKKVIDDYTKVEQFLDKCYELIKTVNKDD